MQLDYTHKYMSLFLIMLSETSRMLRRSKNVSIIKTMSKALKEKPSQKPPQSQTKQFLIIPQMSIEMSCTKRF